MHPERVLNACAAAGIACTASEPVDAYTLRITVRARCADTVTELARRSQCEVKTLYRRGLPQLLRRAVKGAPRERLRLAVSSSNDFCASGVEVPAWRHCFARRQWFCKTICLCSYHPLPLCLSCRSAA